MKITEENKNILWKSHGVKCKARIQGTPCEGVIGIWESKDLVAICQNERFGLHAPEDVLQGYNYAFSITNLLTNIITLRNVDEFEIFPEDESLQETENFLKITRDVEDILFLCDGLDFKCKIQGESVSGKIGVVNKDVYLCQDKFDGKYYPNNYGHLYTFVIINGADSYINEEKITDLEVLIPESIIKTLNSKPELKEVGEFVVESEEFLRKDDGTEPCNPIEDAIDLLKSNGYKVLKPVYHEV